VFVVLILSLSVDAAHGGQSDAEWRKRFEAEAARGWENYRQANRHAQITIRGESQGSDPRQHRGETEWRCNETCRLVRVTDRNTGSSEIIGQNPKYWFRLKSGKDGAWTLLEFYQGEQLEAERAWEIDRRIDMHRSGVAEQVVRLSPDGQPLGEIVQSPRTRITAVRPKPRDGVELIEVQFEVTPNPTDARKLVGGTLLLDPSRDWLPVAHTASVRNQVGTGTHTSEFEFGPGPHPPLRRVVARMEYNFFDGSKPWQSTSTVEYDVRVPDPLPDTHEFTLSAFGLPEPPGVTWERPTPRYIWFLLAAGGFALLAVVFRLLARRTKPTNSTATT
jgi:hypothetical protein